MHENIDFHKFMLQEACVFAVSLIPSPPYTYNSSHIDLLSLYSLQSPAHSRVEEVDEENHILSQCQNQINQQMANKNGAHSYGSTKRTMHKTNKQTNKKIIMTTMSNLSNHKV